MNLLDALSTALFVSLLPEGWALEGNPLLRIGGGLFGMWILVWKMCVAACLPFILTRFVPRGRDPILLWGSVVLLGVVGWNLWQLHLLL